MSTKVILAYPYTDADGKEHKPDATLSLEDAEANRLIFYGLAREPETTKSAEAEKKGS